MNKFNKKTYFLETYGCSANQADSDRLIQQLQSKSWLRVENPKNADLSIVNSCGVKDPTEIKVLKSIRNISEIDTTTLVITGCLPAISYKQIVKEAPNYGAIFDTKSTHLFKNIIKRLNSGETGIDVFSSKSEAENKIDILPVLNSPVIGILTINEGCDGNCTFCGTKLARGSTVRFAPDSLVSQVEHFLKKGAKIIWLTSQDTGAYSWESPEKYWELPELIDSICSLPYKFRLRIGMINPDHSLRLSERLIHSYQKNPQVFQFLHIPVQSGNDRILKLMKRRYSAQEFEIIIEDFRKNIPDLTISTDIITGFPTETEKEFLDTLNLIKRTNPDILNISRYGARPGTIAAKMDGQVYERVSKERSRMITTVWQNQVSEYNKKWLNWEGNVIIEDFGKRQNNEGKNTFIARNHSYRPIILPENEFYDNPLGKFYKIRITEVNTHYLLGKVKEIHEPLLVD
jgi:MiaB-like tRNA modifying enzyme